MQCYQTQISARANMLQATSLLSPYPNGIYIPQFVSVAVMILGGDSVGHRAADFSGL